MLVSCSFGGKETAVVSAKVTVEVGGRKLVLSNLTKVLYPDRSVTKAAVVDYYRRVAPALLGHLQGRPLTVVRFPDGIDGPSFFEKQAPRGAPQWVRTAQITTRGGRDGRDAIDYVVVDDLATLVWLANLAAIEMHVPMWRVDGEGRALAPDEAVFDLDPGEQAGMLECCQVALLVREELKEDGLECWAKTSGSKGLQCYAGLDGTAPSTEVSAYARAVAERLAGRRPDMVVSTQAKEARRGKVLVDWSQNSAAKTTVAPYSLRARADAPVSTPLLWSEVEAALERGDADELRFGIGQVLERLEGLGDLFSEVLQARGSLSGDG